MRQPGMRAAAFSLLIGLWASSAGAALESGDYQTLPGVTIEEQGDRVPNGSRVMPLTASLTFDLSAVPPSLTTYIADAVLEGGEPFALAVRSFTGERLTDGTYRFTGDYLREIYPSGTQYGFDWRFSTSPNGKVLWNGHNAWYGGHIWVVTISNIIIVPQARLSISRAESASARITWKSNFADHILEYTTRLPAAGWTTVSNAPSIAGDRLFVTVNTDASQRFYRLRKP